MNKLCKIASLILLYFNFCSISHSAENLFYILHTNLPALIAANQDSFTSLESHYNSISMLAPQAYQVDEKGIVWGSLDKDILNFAAKHAIKLMPLITNAGFDKIKTHKFLSSTRAQRRAIESILEACNKNHFYGVQFDFEMVKLEDKNALTSFYQTAAKVLHQNGYIVSFAVAPLITNDPLASEFQKRQYTNWEGAYDLKAIGSSANFITILTYNQHSDGTTPGPTAGIRWVDAAIRYALQYIPAHKISLGVSAYSGYWYTGTSSDNPSGKIASQFTAIGYDKVKYLLKKYHAKLQWDDKDKINYSIYQHDWLNEYIYAEDARSFKAKLDLVKKYNLRGISMFFLGIEDPQIWNELTKS